MVHDYGPNDEIQVGTQDPPLQIIHRRASQTSAPLKYVLSSNSQVIVSMVKLLSMSVLC